MSVAALFALLVAGTAGATTPEEILQKADELRKVANSAQKLRMTLVSKSGSERVREFETRVRRDDDALRSWTRFTHPSDVAGTQLVLVDHPDQADDQLLYLPALKRVNRIAGRARTGAFMGSDFAFEDLELQNTDDASHTVVSETAEAWVIQSVPGPSSTSSYGRVVATVRRADHLPTRVEYFDKKNELVKILEVKETLESEGRSYPKLSVMTNQKKGTATRLEVLEQRLNLPATELPDEMFTAAWMERNP